MLNTKNKVHYSLGSNEITSKGASVLFDSLSKCNSAVSILDLTENQLNDECMKQLGEFIQDNKHLDNLVLDFNKITDKGIEILAEYLVGNTVLSGFSLMGNSEITNASMPFFIDIANTSCITFIDVSITQLSDEAVQELEDLFETPIDQREIPTKSNAKSAAKISN